MIRPISQYWFEWQPRSWKLTTPIFCNENKFVQLLNAGLFQKLNDMTNYCVNALKTFFIHKKKKIQHIRFQNWFEHPWSVRVQGSEGLEPRGPDRKPVCSAPMLYPSVRERREERTWLRSSSSSGWSRSWRRTRRTRATRRWRFRPDRIRRPETFSAKTNPMLKRR